MAKSRAYRVRAKVDLDTTALRKLRSEAAGVLRDLDFALLAAIRRVMDNAAFEVPRGGAPDDPIDLADTAFTSGPAHNLKRQSTTMTGGYAHQKAGPIHEGFHWGEQIFTPPPHFLRKAAKRGVRPLLVKGVRAALWASLKKRFPSK